MHKTPIHPGTLGLFRQLQQLVLAYLGLLAFQSGLRGLVFLYDRRKAEGRGQRAEGKKKF